MKAKTYLLNSVLFIALIHFLASSDLYAQETSSDYLTPLFRTDSSSIYDINGMKVEVEPDSKVSFITGPDFRVYNFVLLGNDSVGLYCGRHPDVPHFSSLAFKRGRNEIKHQYLNQAIENDGHYLKKVLDPTLIFDSNDSIIGTSKDSLIWELIVMQDKILWVTRPMENRSGQVDILIELIPENERTYYHLFGRSNRNEYAEVLIDLAKTMN